MSLAVHSKCGFKSWEVPKILSKNILTSLLERIQLMLKTMNLPIRVRLSQKMANPSLVKCQNQANRSVVEGNT